MQRQDEQVDVTTPHHVLTDAQEVFQMRTLQRYRDADERWFQRWRDGDRAAPKQCVRPWIRDVVAPAVDAGRTLQLVHVVVGPADPYVMFLMECYRHRLAAGEDIRVLGVAYGSWPSGIWRQDTTLGGNRVAHHWHDQHGRLERVDVHTAPVLVRAAQEVQRLALARAHPLARVLV